MSQLIVAEVRKMRRGGVEGGGYDNHERIRVFLFSKKRNGGGGQSRVKQNGEGNCSLGAPRTIWMVGVEQGYLERRWCVSVCLCSCVFSQSRYCLSWIHWNCCFPSPRSYCCHSSETVRSQDPILSVGVSSASSAGRI